MMQVSKRSLYQALLALMSLFFLWGALQPQPIYAQDEAGWLIGQVNSLRGQQGLGGLSVNGALSAAAQSHSDWMAATGIISHTQDNGSTPESRSLAAGYGGRWVSENIYGGSRASAQTAWAWWLNSSTHYNSMVHPRKTEIGVGVASGDGMRYYVLILGEGSGGGAPPVVVDSSPPEQNPAPEQAPAPQSPPEVAGAPAQAAPPDQGSVYVAPRWTARPDLPSPTPTQTWTPTATWTPSPTTTDTPPTSTPIVLPSAAPFNPESAENADTGTEVALASSSEQGLALAPISNAVDAFMPAASSDTLSSVESETRETATIPTETEARPPAQIAAKPKSGLGLRTLLPLAIAIQVLGLGWVFWRLLGGFKPKT